MKLTNITRAAVCAVLVASTVGVMAAYAEDSDHSPSPSASSTAGIAQRCLEWQRKAAEKSQETLPAEKAHVKEYEALVKRVQLSIDRAKAHNLDTTKLETDFAALQVLIAQFKTDHTTYVQFLLNIKTEACTHPDDFKNQVRTTARSDFDKFRSDEKKIRTAVTTIKADIKALRTKKTEATASPSPSASATESSEHQE